MSWIALFFSSSAISEKPREEVSSLLPRYVKLPKRSHFRSDFASSSLLLWCDRSYNTEDYSQFAYLCTNLANASNQINY